MLTWVKIGLRNLLKHKRRSFFTLGAVGMAFAAVNVFGGFMRYIYQSFSDGYVYAQAYGHLSISREGFRQQGQQNPAAYLLTSNDIAVIENTLRRDPRVKLLSPELRLQGMVSNGKISTIFLARGFIPEVADEIRRNLGRSWIRSIHAADGKPMTRNAPQGIGVGNGMLERLGLKLYDDAMLMALTAEGQMNALDAQVFLSFGGGGDQIGDKLILAPLSLLQRLYDVDGADTVNVLLTNDRDTDIARADLARAVRAAGVPVEVGTWYDICPSYLKTVDMFNVIFAFIFGIVFVIVALSVINTVSMSVIERTREIGTLRAVGLRRRGVIVLFATESGLLAVLGSVLGVLLTLLTWFLIGWLKPTWSPPMVVGRIPIEVHLVPRYMLQAGFSLVALAVVAAVSPARRAARANIVDSLGHV
jgi:putative ABC transport system permease protein